MKWLKHLFRKQSHEDTLRSLARELSAQRTRERGHVVQAIESVVNAPSAVSEGEIRSLERSSEQLIADRCAVIHKSDAVPDLLHTLWHPPAIPEDDDFACYDISDSDSPKSRSPPQRKTESRDWALTLTDEFIKCTRSIDRKLQGRILEALLVIGSAPTAAQGDTVKPLTGDLAGLWRYRLGDYRLIYKPDRLRMHVFVLSFGARGGVYH